jgi:hypothetical protein
MPSVTGNLTGGAYITSYNLQYNGGGSSTIFISLVGEAPLSLSQTYKTSGLTTNTVYVF